MDYADLSPAEAKQAIVDDPEMIVLDVRTEPEHRMHRIDGAILVPVQELPQRIGELDPARRYVVTCEHGVRSRMACSLLVQSGFRDLRNVVGGMARWVGEGLPIVRG
ncbi:MAG: rhodanese-like domain-containing protein [Planctomycetota bacterium]|nr:rhodanese-like domain-containing protein [Planctomycetota bacterium]MDA0933264.1 rhodanese-like domain-containing protein [Planctomycetota bacterium]